VEARWEYRAKCEQVQARQKPVSAPKICHHTNAVSLFLAKEQCLFHIILTVEMLCIQRALSTVNQSNDELSYFCNKGTVGTYPYQFVQMIVASWPLKALTRDA
jgi:hypothetical protein